VTLRTSGWLTIAAALLLAVSAPTSAADPIRISWTPWADGMFVTRLAERIISERIDHPVELVEAPISEQYQGIAAGRIDAMLMSWQPETHAPYMRRISDRVEHLGVLYDGARLGWAVPDYVPSEEIASIADLAAQAERFGGQITGIDPDAGLTRLSRQALNRYDLDDYELTTSSGPDMAERLREATEAGEWIVVTAWNPHWIFAAFDLRYLDDPRAILGGAERVQVLARPGFYADHPAAARMLARMYLDLDTLEAALLQVERFGHDAAVDHYMEAHDDQIDYWVNGASANP